jgi:hypothetical protein
MNTQATLLYYCLIACIYQQSHATSTFSSNCLRRAGLWACVTRDGGAARRGVACLYKGIKCQDLPVLFGKLVLPCACENSAARTSRTRPITSAQLASGTTHSELNTNTGDDLNSSCRVFSCHYFLKTSKTFHKRKRSNSRNFLVKRNKKSSVYKASTYISDTVFAEHINRCKFRKESVVSKSNTESTFERSHGCSFPVTLNSNDPGPTVTEITITFYIINNQTNIITAANKCAKIEIIIAVLDTNVEKCIASSSTACGFVCWLACVQAPTAARIVTLLPCKTCRRRFCKPMECYFEGHCFFLQRLQQEGKFVRI